MTWGSVSIRAGARGFDALGDPAPPAQLVRDGWLFRTIYICQSKFTSLTSKITEKTHTTTGAVRIANHIGAGIGVLLNYESSGDRWKSGAAGGAADGAWCYRICSDLDYPEGLVIPVSSWDSETRPYLRDPKTGRMYFGPVNPTAIAYGESFCDELNGRWGLGVYGGTPIMHELAHRCDFGWKAMATSWSSGGSYPLAMVHVNQRRPTSRETAAMPYATSTTLDVDDALVSIDVWGLVKAPPPRPPRPRPPYNPTPVQSHSFFPPGGDMITAMARFVVDGEDKLYCSCYDGGYKRWEQDGDMIDCTTKLAALNGKDVRSIVTIDDPNMWKAMGPIAGPIPPGFDAYGLPS